MIKTNIHDAKTHLSEYLAKLGEGETILLCKRNKPVAEIRLLPQQSVEMRPIGLAAATFCVPASFFEPLPEEILRSFHCEGG